MSTNPKTRAAMVALLFGALVFVLKLLGAWLTGSVGVLSDALESSVNIIAAIFTAWAVGIASRPPDSSHPYGHDKAESLSSLLEALLIGVAATLVMSAAFGRLFDPTPLEFSPIGMGLTVVASLINFGLGRYLVAVGRKFDSPALQADGQHVLSDVLTSVGVLVGVFLAAWTRLPWLDPVLALAVAVLLFYTAVHLLRQHINSLMDAALEQNDIQRVQQVFEQEQQHYLEIHDLRTRISGKKKFIDFHLIVPARLTVLESHALCDRLENAIEQALPNASVTIHVEPEAFLRGTK
ncbi:MAG: cation diffusion facilitator family transporter [Deinococcales bacterium]